MTWQISTQKVCMLLITSLHELMLLSKSNHNVHVPHPYLIGKPKSSLIQDAISQNLEVMISRQFAVLIGFYHCAFVNAICNNRPITRPADGRDRPQNGIILYPLELGEGLIATPRYGPNCSKIHKPFGARYIGMLRVYWTLIFLTGKFFQLDRPLKK